MVALTQERAGYHQDPNLTHYHEPFPLENAVKAFKGGLAGYYFQGANKGEVAPLTGSEDMVGIGQFTETVDNANDGETAMVQSGVFVWSNATAGAAVVASDAGQFVYGLDDQTVSRLGYVATADPVVVTGTPTAVNDTQYAALIEYRKPGENLWRTAVLAYVSDASATDTEICDGLRAALTANADLAGVVTGSGTTTLVLTGAEGVDFKATDIGAGVLSFVVTDAGTLTRLGKAGILLDLTPTGPAVFSHFAVYGGFSI